MPDIDSRIKAVAAVLLVLCGVLFYRMRHPATIFAADGMDSNWDAAVQRSRHSGQPTVVLFTANWCPACRALHGNVLSRSDVQEELQSHYNFYAVDLSNPTPRVQAHARKLGVEYIPLMIRYDVNGKETDRTNYREPTAMIAWLKAGE
jgi:thiol:disulfide interchange protein